MLLFCDNVYNLTKQEYETLFLAMPLDRKKKILKYVKQEDRILSVTAYSLFKYAMHLIGKSSTNMEIEVNPYGKPYIKNNDIYFNISHTENAVACAIGFSEVGVDIQKNVTGYEKIMKWVCSPLERERILRESSPIQYFTKLWTLKESYVKCIGTGIWDDITRIDFSDFYAEHGLVQGYYFNCKCENDYCVSVCSKEKKVEIQKVTVSDIVQYERSEG